MLITFLSVNTKLVLILKIHSTGMWPAPLQCDWFLNDLERLHVSVLLIASLYGLNWPTPRPFFHFQHAHGRIRLNPCPMVSPKYLFQSFPKKNRQPLTVNKGLILMCTSNGPELASRSLCFCLARGSECFCAFDRGLEGTDQLRSRAMSCRVFFCPLGGLATHSWSVVGAGFRHSLLVGGLEQAVGSTRCGRALLNVERSVHRVLPWISSWASLMSILVADFPLW